MFDHSRNAVFTVERTRDFLCLMALMGLDVYYPYLEDLYTLPQEPLFGYLRGRYTEEEVRAIDDFADSLGIEVVPCIQTLAHLNQFLRWDQPAADYLDLDDILLFCRCGPLPAYPCGNGRSIPSGARPVCG